jgi:aryl-alcohol dehydrogenase-like predicted oxidoreductase
VNYTGNSRKSMHMSVDASLKKLKTDYIDLLYVHWCTLKIMGEKRGQKRGRAENVFGSGRRIKSDGGRDNIHIFYTK